MKRTIKLEESKNEYRFRIEDPEKFDDFRAKKIKEGLYFIIGIKYSPYRTTKIQSIRYKKDKYSLEDAIKSVKRIVSKLTTY